MAFFTQAEGEAAILVKRGTYKTCDVYTRDGYLYARYGSGLVRIMADGSTSIDARVDFMTYNGPLARDKFGRLCEAGVEGAQRLTVEQRLALLGAA